MIDRWQIYKIWDNSFLKKVQLLSVIMKFNFFLLLALFQAVSAEILTLDRNVLNQIYQENKLYMLYVHGSSHNFQVESVFNSYCFGERSCAILEPNNPDYYQLLQFFGYTQNEYFLIIDANTKRKYIHPITNEPITTNDLLSFEYKFLFKELQPYFSSQSLPEEINQRCTKLVGKNLGEFLRRKERVKVILLYTLTNNCPSCDRVLQLYMPFAQRVAFGYFNTFLNDHPIIQDEKTPSFIIFVDEQYQTPFSLQAKDMEGLSFFLQKMLGSSISEERGGEVEVSVEQNEL